MSAPLFDRLRELVPALGTVSGLAYADTNGTAVLGIEAQRALITALTPCACGAVAGQDCAPDCDLDAGTCDTCGTPYDSGSRDGRCGDCGECAAHCDHDAAVPWCACVCRCTYRLDGYAAGETLCGACLDNCDQDAAVPCEICGTRAGLMCECAAHCDHDANAWRCSCLCGCDSWLPALRQQTCDTCHDRCVGSGAFPTPAVTA